MKLSSGLIFIFSIVAIVLIVSLVNQSNTPQMDIFNSEVIVGQAIAKTKTTLAPAIIEKITSRPTTIPKTTYLPSKIPKTTSRPTTIPKTTVRPTSVVTTTTKQTTTIAPIMQVNGKVCKTSTDCQSRYCGKSSTGSGLVCAIKPITIPTSIPTTIPPKLSDSKACKQDSDCLNAHCGYVGVSTTKLCFTPKKDGSRCNANADCLGESCVGSGSQKVCKSLFAVGKTCAQDSDCQSAHCGYAGVSTTKLCFIPKTDGSRCSANTDCASGYCGKSATGPEKVCRTLLVDGKTCIQDGDCQSMRCGFSGVSTSKLCFTPKINGARCNIDGDCVSGYCKGLGTQKTCQCKPNCGTGLDMKNCGADGCGGTCGNCYLSWSCIKGKCSVALASLGGVQIPKPNVLPLPVSSKGDLCLTGVDEGEWRIYDLSGGEINSGEISGTGFTEIYMGGLAQGWFIILTPYGATKFLVSDTGSEGGCTGVTPITIPPSQARGWVRGQYKCEGDSYFNQILYQLYQYAPAQNGMEADIDWREKTKCERSCDEIAGLCPSFNSYYTPMQVNKCSDDFLSTFVVTRQADGSTSRGTPRPCVLGGRSNYCNPNSGECFTTLHETPPTLNVILDPDVSPPPPITPVQIPTTDGTYNIFRCEGRNSMRLTVRNSQPNWLLYQSCVSSCNSYTGLCEDVACTETDYGADIFVPGICLLRGGQPVNDNCSGEMLRESVCTNYQGGFMCDSMMVRCPLGNCIRDDAGFGYCEPETVIS